MQLKNPFALRQSPWQQFCKQLERTVGQDGLIRQPEELLTYESDGLPCYRERPALAVLPRTTEQVAQAIRLCNDYGITWVARGAGTGLSGGALPIREGVLIVTSRMNRILAVDTDNQRVVVQPGAINNWVTQAVSEAGFYYAPDPSSQSVCTIGGNIAENSGGVHCLKYGVTTNHVLGLKAVTAQGEIVELGGEVPEMPGYDLTGLFVGSEGTLGLATEITLSILKTPESACVLLADFASMEAAGQAVTDIVGAGIIPAGMEMMDNLSINAVEDVVGSGCYPRDAAAVLLVELDGLSEEVEADVARVADRCERAGARSTQTAWDAATQQKFWKGRKAAFAAAGNLSPDYFIQDGVIPRTQLSWVLGEIEALSQRFGYRIANVFHAGDGNLHPLILYDNSVEGQLAEVETLGREILKRCVQAGGSISGEHGIGADKNCFMPDMFSATDLETMRRVRLAFDPNQLANSEKLFPTPRTCGEAAHAHQWVETQGAQLY